MGQNPFCIYGTGPFCQAPEMQHTKSANGESKQTNVFFFSKFTSFQFHAKYTLLPIITFDAMDIYCNI